MKHLFFEFSLHIFVSRWLRRMSGRIHAATKVRQYTQARYLVVWIRKHATVKCCLSWVVCKCVPGFAWGQVSPHVPPRLQEKLACVGVGVRPSKGSRLLTSQLSRSFSQLVYFLAWTNIFVTLRKSPDRKEWKGGALVRWRWCWYLRCFPCAVSLFFSLLLSLLLSCPSPFVPFSLLFVSSFPVFCLVFLLVLELFFSYRSLRH